MINNLPRRHFIKYSSASLLAGATGLSIPNIALGAVRKVVVIGGGAGGTIAAKYIKKSDPSIEVTLIESNKTYDTCFMSNEVIGGGRKIESIVHGYDGLKKRSINIVHSTASAIDIDKKTVLTSSGDRFKYDRLIVSPGISLKTVSYTHLTLPTKA